MHEGGDLATACTNTVCPECWARHAQRYLNEWRMPPCIRCSKPLTIAFLGTLPPRPGFPLVERADAVLLRKFLLLTPSVYHCPRNGCPSSFIVEPDKRVCAWGQRPACFTVKCPACTQEICTGCKGAAHLTPCNKLALDGGEEVARWRQANTKPCPGCKLPVEKNGGCHHMACSACQLEFCWDCLVPFAGHVCAGPPLPVPAAPAPVLRRAPRPPRSDRPPRRPDPARRHPRAAPPPVAAPAAAAPVEVKKKEKKKKEKEPAPLLFDPRALRRSVLV